MNLTRDGPFKTLLESILIRMPGSTWKIQVIRELNQLENYFFVLSTRSFNICGESINERVVEGLIE